MESSSSLICFIWNTDLYSKLTSFPCFHSSFLPSFHVFSPTSSSFLNSFLISFFPSFLNSFPPFAVFTSFLYLLMFILSFFRPCLFLFFLPSFLIYSCGHLPHFPFLTPPFPLSLIHSFLLPFTP